MIKRYSFAILYIVLTAISVVYINKLGQFIPDDLLMLLGSFYAIIFFHAINIKNIPNTYKKALAIKPLLFLLLFTFLIAWVFTIIIPIYYTPALLVFFFMAWPACLGSYFQYQHTKSKMDLIRSILIALLIGGFYICLGFIYKMPQYLYLLISLTVVGFAGFWYLRLSFKMNQLNFNATEILSIRFWLLFLIPLIITIYNGHIHLITSHILIDTFILSFISMIIPVYCSQISIQKIGPNIHSMLVGLTPFVAFLFESVLVSRGISNTLNGWFSSALFIIILGGYLISNRTSRK